MPSSTPKLTKKPKYTYQDCWNYAFSLKNDLSPTEKNALVALCKTTPEIFWKDFTQKTLSFSAYQKICQNFKKYLQKNIPLPYLTKQVYFYQLPFQIQKGIFIPQKETEILVEKVLEISQKHWPEKEKLRVLELGTGCGNITLSFAKLKPHWKITAVDISKKALRIAQTNAKNHQINNVNFLFSNLFSNLNPRQKFDIIISNPPYVSKKEYEKLPLIVKKQPKKALFAAENGIFFYRQIFSEATNFLKTSSILAVEISPQLEKSLLKLIISHFSQNKIQIFPDYNEKSRIILSNQKKVR